MQSSDVTSTGTTISSAEFLRLNISAPRERLAGDTGRETEVIFDSRTCARLTAECISVEHKYGKSFRRSIYRSSKTGGASANDRNVVDMVGAQIDIQAEVTRKLPFGGAFKDRSIGTNNQRQFILTRLVELRHIFRNAIKGRIQQHMGMTVP